MISEGPYFQSMLLAGPTPQFDPIHCTPIDIFDCGARNSRREFSFGEFSSWGPPPHLNAQSSRPILIPRGILSGLAFVRSMRGGTNGKSDLARTAGQSTPRSSRAAQGVSLPTHLPMSRSEKFTDAEHLDILGSGGWKGFRRNQG